MPRTTLPRNWASAMTRASAASQGLKNLLIAGDPNYEILYTHFLGDALPGDWAAAAGTNGTVSVATSKLTLTSTTTDNESAGQGYGLFWKGSRGFYMETAVALDTVTSSKIEVGITDATGDDGAVNAKATPTATADDFCVLVRDTDDNTELDIISGINTVITANAENVSTVAAATLFRPEFRGQGTAVQVFVNGNNVGAGSITSTDAVTPWFYCQSRTTAARILTAEYLVMVGPSGLAI